MLIGTVMLLGAASRCGWCVWSDWSAVLAGGAFVLAGAGMGLGFTRTGVAMLAASSDADRGFNSSAISSPTRSGAALALSLCGIGFAAADRAGGDPFLAVFGIAILCAAVAAVTASRTPCPPRSTGTPRCGQRAPVTPVADERRHGERRQHRPDHDQHAAAGRGDGGPGHGRRRTVRRRRPPAGPRDDHDEDALQPAAHGVGRPPTAASTSRNAAEAMSAAPPTASITTATTSIAVGASGASRAATPNPVIATPHTRIATITASPCRSTRDTQPDSTPPIDRAGRDRGEEQRERQPALGRARRRRRRRAPGTAPAACRRPSRSGRRRTTSAAPGGRAGSGSRRPPARSPGVAPDALDRQAGQPAPPPRAWRRA